MRIRFIALPLGLAAMALAGSAGSAQEIGAAGAVNPATAGTPPGRPTRVIELGARVIHKERIQTTTGGSVQLIFLDKTTLNVGPNSDLVIDEFIYDPSRGAGQMAVSMTKGVLRFVGGNISHAGNASVKTPAATLGIRGGVATIKHQPCGVPPAAGQGLLVPDAPCGTRAINHFGVMTVSTAVGTEVIRRPGFAVTIVPGAATLPAPTRVSQAEVEATNLQLSSKPGQKGGAPSQPTEQTAVRAGVGIQNAGIGPSLIPVQPQTTASGPVQIAAAVAIQQGVQNLQQTAGNSATQAATETIVIEEERNRRPPQPPRPQPTGVKVFALVTSPDPALNSSVPFVAGTVVASGGVQVSPVFGFRNAGTEEDPTPKARTLQVAFGVNGSGASQSSNFMVATGAFAVQPEGKLVFRGGFGASSRNAAAVLPSSARGTIASSGAVTVDADRVPTNATVNQNRIDRAGAVVSNSARTVVAGVPGANYGFEQSFSPATPPEALGQNRPAGTLTGFMGGMVQTRGPEGNVVAAAPLIGANAVTLDPGDSRVQMNAAVFAIHPGSSPPPGALADAMFQFGSLDPTKPARSTYIDRENFAAREAVDTSTSPPRTTGLVNGAAVDRETLLMAGANTPAIRAGLQNAFPAVAFCQCEYTRWGLWSASTQRSGFSDGVQLGTWVAGELPANPQIPTTGTATYAGHVAATIQNGTSQYLAAGNLTSTLNFGNPLASSAQVANLDGFNYAGPLTVSGNGLGGVLTSGTGPAANNLLMVGSLFKGVMHPSVGEMGGLVLINANQQSVSSFNYTGSGIFAARMTGSAGLGP
jgi:FecR protein